MIKTLLAALSFLTPAPVSVRYRVDEEVLARSMFFFPFVGLAIGAILVAVALGARKVFAPGPWMNDVPPNGVGLAAFCVVVAWAVCSSGFHLDGLADTVDGLLGGGDRMERLRIMHSSGIGAFAASALVCLLLGKFLAVQAILSRPDETARAVAAIAVAPALGRWCMCFLAGISGPATPESGLGRLFAGRADFGILCLSLLLPLVLTIYLLRFPGGCGLLAAMLLTILISSVSNRKIGGITGDIFGAVCELSELILLMAFAI